MFSRDPYSVEIDSLVYSHAQKVGMQTTCRRVSGDSDYGEERKGRVISMGCFAVMVQRMVVVTPHPITPHPISPGPTPPRHGQRMLLAQIRSMIMPQLMKSGYVEMQSPVLMPYNKYIQELYPKAYLLLDRAGTPVALRPDLRVSFALYCVRNLVSRVRRYEFAPIFRSQDLAGGRPLQNYVASVDNVWLIK